MQRRMLPRVLVVTSFEFCLAVMLCSGRAASQSFRIEGAVRDSSGAAVVGAKVDLRAASTFVSRITDSSGNFIFDSVPRSSGTVSVQARGFAIVQQNWNAGTGESLHLEIVLSPAAATEEIVVTAARIETRLSDVAGSAVALSPEDLNSTPALLVDDKLRQIPGFTLFRRSDSRTANPTSQGVSLNALGASGSSRALVLQDGIPLNDPFGGWVYWGRIAQEELASVEVMRGGISSLYGSNALGGVIQFLSRSPEPRNSAWPAFSLETSYGSEKTPDLSFWAGEHLGTCDAAIAADLFHTDGYIVVPAAQLGSVDTPANAEHAAVDLSLGRHFGEHSRVFARGSFFIEARNNGTVVQTNDTRTGQGAVGVDTQLGAAGSLSVRLYGDSQGYNQSFSSVAVTRMSESLTDRQHVPAQQLGGSALWSRPLGHKQSLVAGVDAVEVMGWSDESLFTAGTNTADTISGGRQRTAGVFGEDILQITPKWIVTAAARFDDWRNFDALSLRMPISTSGPTTITPFADRTENAFSPRLSVLYALTSNVSLTGSMSRAFRTPTLNELYRSFRLGNTVTNANSALRAEHLTGAEAGVHVYALRRKLNMTGNFFWDDIVDPLANVPISTTPSLITQQRKNLGRTRSRGVDLDAGFRISDAIEISGGYQFADATVVQAPAFQTLVGLRIAEVPRHQFTLQGRYSNPRFVTLSVQGRYSGDQFDDAPNTLLLPHYFTLDLLVSRSLGHGVDAFGAFENLTNQRDFTALTPVATPTPSLLPTLGPPFVARVGLRLNFPSRQ
jgi:outer membrane receptor protein involved in Fe transport